jgi:hypothetical protein
MCLLLAGTQSEIIDRIAVTLDNQVITASGIALEIRLTAFLNGAPLDFSPDARRKGANRLIEQKLIRREMQVGRYIQPAPEEVEPLLKQVQAQRFHSQEQYRQALVKYGIRDDELKQHLLWQLTLLRFVDIRFRPAVQVTDRDIQAYFERHSAQMEAQAGVSGKPALDDVRDQIRRILTDEGADKELDNWLAGARKRARVEFHPEAFR